MTSAAYVWEMLCEAPPFVTFEVPEGQVPWAWPLVDVQPEGPQAQIPWPWPSWALVHVEVPRKKVPESWLSWPWTLVSVLDLEVVLVLEVPLVLQMPFQIPRKLQGYLGSG